MHKAIDQWESSDLRDQYEAELTRRANEAAARRDAAQTRSLRAENARMQKAQRQLETAARRQARALASSKHQEEKERAKMARAEKAAEKRKNQAERLATKMQKRKAKELKDEDKRAKKAMRTTVEQGLNLKGKDHVIDSATQSHQENTMIAQRTYIAFSSVY